MNLGTILKFIGELIIHILEEENSSFRKDFLKQYREERDPLEKLVNKKESDNLARIKHSRKDIFDSLQELRNKNKLNVKSVEKEALKDFSRRSKFSTIKPYGKSSKKSNQSNRKSKRGLHLSKEEEQL